MEWKESTTNFNHIPIFLFAFIDSIHSNIINIMISTKSLFFFAVVVGVLSHSSIATSSSGTSTYVQQAQNTIETSSSRIDTIHPKLRKLTELQAATDTAGSENKDESSSWFQRQMKKF